jgi:hypothetical protein
MSAPPVEITADSEGLWLTASARHRFLPFSQTEFFDEDSPGTRLAAIKDQQGRVTGLMITGLGPAPFRATRLP